MAQIKQPYSVPVAVDAAGNAHIYVKPTGQQRWKIQQIGIEYAAAPGGAKANIRINGTLLYQFTAATAGNYNPSTPVELSSNDLLSIGWSGGTSGDLAIYALVVYDDGTK